MSLNNTASADRIHIGFFGMRNAGKSSIVNAVTGQDLSVVSKIMGTTTDPVKKSMELLPLGPVVIIDTPGIDDEGTLGEMRVKKAIQALNYTDIAVLTVDARKGLQEADRRLISLFTDKKIPYIIAYNKTDLPEIKDKTDLPATENPASGIIYVSAETKQNIYELKEMIARIAQKEENQKHIVADLLQAGDLVVLVVPLDSSAPKGRLILPQQQTIRDILDADAIAAVSKEKDLAGTFGSFALIHSFLDFFCKKTKISHNRLPSIRASLQRHPRRYPADLLFHPFCPLQRQFKSSRGRCRSAELPKGRRYGIDFRRLHPSQTVRRHRDGKASCMDKKLHQKGDKLCVHIRHRISGRTVGLCLNHPLRRMYAQRKGNAVPLPSRG